MAVLTDFTSYDEIRAVLGVSEEELEDVTLALPIYLQVLQFDLGDVHSDVESLYETLNATPPPLTTAQQRFLNVAQVFSAYAVSRNLLTSIALFAPKRITDGRAETDRVTDPFEDLRNSVNIGYQNLRNRLVAALEGLGENVNPAASRVYTSTAGLATDPILGT